MKKLVVSISVLLAFLGVSCQQAKNTTTGNPFVSFTITGSSATANVAKNLWEGILKEILPVAYALPAPAAMPDSQGNTVTLAHLWVTVGEIEFKVDEVAGGSEVDGSSVDFSGPYTVDMLENAPSPVHSGRISVSSLRRVKVKMVRTTSVPASAPAGLSAKSIYISGTVNGHAFSYSTQDETVLEVAGPNLVEAVENSNLLLLLRTANLFKRINLSSITTTTHIDDGNRVIATNPCPNIEPSATDLFTCFKKGLQTESTIGRDDNGDDELDSGEDSVD